MNLSLSDAFARFGAKPSTRQRGLSAIAADGALVLNCSPGHFGHPARGVLRYEDRLSGEVATSRDAELLGRHLTLARDGSLPVRMVVTSRADDKNGTGSASCHVRPDLIGKVTMFDGDHFIVDFKRREVIGQVAASGRRR
ncbi:MAG TPA: hypothetical protein VGP32_05345 [Steroidobacteraceae bacterium]|jgi:hypothetical protein|nr:hypothetical protein [Steroidobacteraceae bacterium]